MRHLLLTELSSRVQARSVVTFVGAGVSIQATEGHDLARVASWRGLLESGIERCEQTARGLPVRWGDRQREALTSTDTNELIGVAEQVTQWLGGQQHGEYREWLATTIGRLEATNASVLAALRDLGTPLVTTNYDGLLEESTGLPPVTWVSPGRLISVLRGEAKGVIHLHGYWDDPASVVLGIRSYEKIVNDPLAQFTVQSLLALKTLLFVGCGAGLHDPNLGALMKWLENALSGAGSRHFRLELGDKVGATQAGHPASQRIEVVSYGRSYADLAPFLERLAPKKAPDQPRSPMVVHADVPVYLPDAIEARNDYVTRARSHRCFAELVDLTTSTPLAPSIPIPGLALDCICSVLSRDGRVHLVLPSADSTPNVEAVGRTALILAMLGVRPPYAPLLGRGGSAVQEMSGVSLNVVGSEYWKLICADMAYLFTLGDDLALVPTAGEPINFLWDVTRHVFRSTDITYCFAAHRRDPVKRKDLVELFLCMQHDGLSNVYAGTHGPYTVDDVLIIKRQQGARPRIELQQITGPDRLEAVARGIAVSSDMHGSAFWRRPRQEVQDVAKNILSQVAEHSWPTVRELTVHSNLADGDTPGFLYDMAARAVSLGSVEALPNVQKTDLGNLFVGIDRFNEVLFHLLPAVTNMKFVVTSGEKVFHDGAFWRLLLNRKARFDLEVLLLNPVSSCADVVERARYSDKPCGFLRNEITRNIDVLRAMGEYFVRTGAPVSVRLWLYDEIPKLRMTFVGGRRVVVAHYVGDARTGSDTLFLDIAGDAVQQFGHEYERLREGAQEVPPR